MVAVQAQVIVLLASLGRALLQVVPSLPASGRSTRCGCQPRSMRSMGRVSYTADAPDGGRSSIYAVSVVLNNNRQT